ncbi:hypothetical protein K8I61_09935 [bacterium]|nr:hypothetical protein [bacterium]
MRRGIAGVAFGLSLLSVLAAATSAMAQDDTFSLNGYFMAHYGLFTNTAYHTENDSRGFPKDHGDFAGQLSAARHTLLLEADWRPAEMVRVHAVFRAVRSGALRADRFAQVPDMVADTKYNRDGDVQEEKISRVHDEFYTEDELREIFVDADMGERFNIRAGRQQVSWGEMGNVRSLDVINPVDGSWHLPPFESYEDTRIPLYLVKLLIDVPELDGSLELVYVPLVDEPEDTINTPATFYGAWGVPLASQNLYVSDLRIDDKIIVYPRNDLSEARYGARWKGILGNMTYTFVYYRGHQLSPPIPDHVIKSGTPDADGFSRAQVYLRIPRQDTYGLSLDYAFESPIGAVVKLEAAFSPDVEYPVNSYLSAGFSPDEREGTTWEVVDPSATPGTSPLIADLHSEKRHELNYALELFRANQWRFLNKTSSTITVLRVMQNFYFNPEDIEDGEYKLGNPYVLNTRSDGSTVRNENQYIVYAPGYDTTIAPPIRTTLVFAAFTTYFHGLLTPGVVAVFLPRYNPPTDSDSITQPTKTGVVINDPGTEIEGTGDLFDWEAFEKGSGFISTYTKWAIGDYWRVEVGYNYIFGADPYYDLGFFRDRDEVYGKVQLQF